MQQRISLSKAIKKALERQVTLGPRTLSLPTDPIAAPHCCCYVAGRPAAPIGEGPEGAGGCTGPCRDCICQKDPFCCERRWDSLCVQKALPGGECADQCDCPHGPVGDRPQQPGRRPPEGYEPGPNRPWPYTPDTSRCANPCYPIDPEVGNMCSDYEPYYGPYYPSP